ncbi:MAG: hypothetical protein HC790_11295 [Acaryochloridaceae cyanobacterium CSU_3_4]|nr:hypothetical protein [Acaryochloridaceae cyanobacterium CSU_3_4]
MTRCGFCGKLTIISICDQGYRFVASNVTGTPKLCHCPIAYRLLISIARCMSSIKAIALAASDQGQWICITPIGYFPRL